MRNYAFGGHEAKSGTHTFLTARQSNSVTNCQSEASPR
jgi:hypothetical protein